MTLSDQVKFLARASHVRRYHNRTTIQTDTVGRHSFMVAWIVKLIMGDEPETPLVMMAALEHDIAEAFMGDIPSPVTHHTAVEGLEVLERDGLQKTKLKLIELGPNAALVLKTADALEGLLFCQHEVAMGNSTIYSVGIRYRGYITELLGKLPQELSRRARAVFVAVLEVRQPDIDEEELCL